MYNLANCFNRAFGAASDELFNIRVTAGIHLGHWPAPADLTAVQHGDIIGYCADRGHVMRDCHGCRTHFDHDFTDQVVDDPCHYWVKAGCGFVEKDDLWLGGDGAGQADALLHTARQFGWKKIGDVWGKSDAAQLLDGNLAGFGFWFLQRTT